MSSSFSTRLDLRWQVPNGFQSGENRAISVGEFPGEARARVTPATSAGLFDRWPRLAIGRLPATAIRSMCDRIALNCETRLRSGCGPWDRAQRDGPRRQSLGETGVEDEADIGKRVARARRLPIPACRPVQDRPVNPACSRGLTRGCYVTAVRPHRAWEPTCGFGPEKADHFGELGKPGHVDELTVRPAGLFEGIVRKAAVLELDSIRSRCDRKVATGPAGATARAQPTRHRSSGHQPRAVRLAADLDRPGDCLQRSDQNASRSASRALMLATSS